ncbi:hypothetical protein [Celeribacter halophilus]|uniref:Tyr recombinase domain-containing protein n=1 Tax=Celeribacter halophilus TaxID=576117 RepID=A0A1I3XCQ3_9RHOB|nr:hypothetical protein [Celeribacter halophilus]PZX03757.1 hypothetical protein LX82_03773 [Celeribacter halophilus]SFK17277.1 hypothetical protein SAMN04488138_1483 [Celeribacter halophilus]
MGKVIVFTPKSTDAKQNFSDYIEAAKSLPFIRTAQFSWDEAKWDLAGLAKPERPNIPPRLNFKGLEGPFGEFSRAFTAHRIAETFGVPKQIGRYNKPIARLRDLAKCAAELGIFHPSDLSLEAFDKTAIEIAAKSKSDYSNAQMTTVLLWVYQALDAAALFHVPFDWDPPITTTKAKRRRINADKPGRPLTSREIEIVAIAFRNSQTQAERLITSILALTCCAPMRINEVLNLPVDCEVLPDPGEGFRGGLRWRPSKGGRPQVKFVPEAMMPVAQEALQRIKDVTKPARNAIHQHIDGSIGFIFPNDYPVFHQETGLTYDKALFVLLRHQLSESNRTHDNVVERLTYAQVRRAMRGDENLSSVFRSTGAIGPDDPPFELTTHMARHYLNTIAQKSNVPQADIALWSGRRLATQNNAYDHETAEELVARIKAKRGPERLPKIKIDDRKSWDMSLVKETAHTTQFGWCQQSLRQDPCQMFGKCLNCQHLVCIKGAEGKLANIKIELKHEIALRERALAKKANGYPIKDRWLALFDKKIARLEELIAILESSDVEDGAAIRLADAGPEVLPQFDMTAFGKARHSLSIEESERRQKENKHGD